MDTLCTTYLPHQATPKISSCPMTPSEQPLPRPALLQSNSCCSGGGKSAQPTSMPEIVPQLSEASQLPAPGPPSPTSSCDWASQPAGLGTSTVHQCAHCSHNPVITGGVHATHTEKTPGMSGSGDQGRLCFWAPWHTFYIIQLPNTDKQTQIIRQN